MEYATNADMSSLFCRIEKKKEVEEFYLIHLLSLPSSPHFFMLLRALANLPVAKEPFSPM